MKHRTRTLPFLAAALILSGCIAGERHAVTVKRQWPAAGIQRIEVQGVNGDLRVDAVDGGDVTLVADIKTRGIAPTNEENRGYFETEVEDGTLRIVQKKRIIRGAFPFTAGAKIEIDYALRVPKHLALDLTTINGRVATRGTLGDAKLKSVNGRIDSEIASAKSFQAQTVNGRIEAKFLTDFTGARLKTVNGGIVAVLPTTASFTCDLSQVNGDFEASFPLSIHSHPGRRRVSGEVNGGRYELQITTVNGNVRVQHVEPPPAPPQPDAPPPPPVTEL